MRTHHRLSEFIFNSDPLAISANGTTIAAGFPFNQNGSTVAVYDFDEISLGWTKRENFSANGTANGFQGWSVALNGAGNILVVGSGGDNAATDAYMWDGAEWNPYGTSLPGAE